MNFDENGLSFKAGLDTGTIDEGAQHITTALSSISSTAVATGRDLDEALKVDPSKTISSILEVSDVMEDVSKVISEMGRDNSLDDVGSKVSALTLLVSDNEEAVMRATAQMEEYREEAKAALAEGDTDKLADLSDKMGQQSEQLKKLADDSAKYRIALAALTDTAQQMRSAEPARVFASEQDYLYAKQLEQQMDELRKSIATFDGSEKDLQGLRDRLLDTQTELATVRNNAADAAQKLGPDLGGRASEASQRLYELNEACREEQKVVADLRAQVEEAAKTYNELRSSSEATTREVDAARARYQELSQQLQNATDRQYVLTAAQREASQSWASVSNEMQRSDSLLVKMLGGQEKYKQIISSMPQPLQNAAQGITGMTGAAKAFIATPLGAVIAAIVLALKALTTWFSSSTDGQMAFAKVSGYVSGMLDQLKEIVIAVGRALYNAFSEPQKTIKKLWDVIKENIVNRFKALGGLCTSIGKLIKSAFTLDTEGLKEGAKELMDNFLMLGTGVEDLEGKVRNMGRGLAEWASGVHDAAKATSDLAVAEKNLDVEVSKWQIRKAELDRIKAEARLKMRDTNLPKEEQEKALQQYKEALQEQLDTEKAFQDRRIEIQRQRMDLTTNTLEDEAKLRQMETERIRLDTEATNELAALQRSANRIEGVDTSALRVAQQQIQLEQQAAKELLKLKEQNQQAEIDLMEEGTAKKIAQIQFDYQRQIEAVREQESKWRQIQDGKLSEEQILAIDNAQDVAKRTRDNALAEANREELDEMLRDVMTYQQQRQQIEEEYSKKREALYDHDEDGNRTALKSGVTSENLDELERKYNEALEAVDEQFAKREDTYNAWCAQISAMTLDQLEEVLDKARAELEQMERESEGDTSKISQARAKVAAAQKRVSQKRAETELAPDKRSIKEWEDLYKTLQQCEREFVEIGEAVGGVVGEIIKGAGEVAASTLSIINGIVTLMDASTTATQTAATTTAKAIQTVETASVILTVISAALQIATKIASLFNNDSAHEKEIEALQNRIDQLQWELDNAEIIRYTNVEESLQRVRNAIGEVRLEYVRAYMEQKRYYDAVNAAFGSVTRNEQILETSAKRLAQSYANLAYTADKALAGDRYREARHELESMAKQQILMQQQIQEQKDKKHTDQKEIDRLEKTMAETGQKMLELINELVEDIIGGTSQDIASKLGDSFIEAFSTGENAARAWGDTVDSIVSDILKRMLIQQFLEKPLGEIFDKYKAKWFPDGNFTDGIQGVIDSMAEFSADLNSVGEGFQAIWEQLPSSVTDVFKSAYSQSTSSGGFMAMSQDTGEELNGRFTALQMSGEAIREHTAAMRDLMEEIRASASYSMGYLESIETNTRELYDINDKLTTIIRNTENL